MRLGMVIDLGRCVGCGACAFACKAENNTRDRHEGQSHNWADFVMKTEGRFPNVVHTVMPVLCNHCSNAACVEACPTTPKAMYKTPEGITMHDDALCVGCRACQNACPYSHPELDGGSLDGASYSVISFNPHGEDTQPRWTSQAAAIAGGTTSGRELATMAGAAMPAMNQWAAGDVDPVRKPGVVEKCTFCYHRTSQGLMPACVEVCPAQARIFGDLDDPASAPSKTLQARKSFRLQEEKGTRPNVHYVGTYAVRG